jgi:DNA anti-recombination protein RmuC
MTPESVHEIDAAKSGAPAAQALSPGPTENVDRIREILFGSQMREYQQRFVQLEDRLLRETSELRSDVRRRVDSVDASARQEVSSLADRLNLERGERREVIDRVSRELTETTKLFERRIAQTEEQMSKDVRELRQLVLDQIRSLAEELTQCVGKAEVLQNRRLEEVRTNSMDRLALADLLAELALRIKGEFQLPEVIANAGANR